MTVSTFDQTTKDLSGTFRVRTNVEEVNFLLSAAMLVPLAIVKANDNHRHYRHTTIEKPRLACV
jgi:hypothetical protein